MDSDIGLLTLLPINYSLTAVTKKQRIIPFMSVLSRKTATKYSCDYVATRPYCQSPLVGAKNTMQWLTKVSHLFHLPSSGHVHCANFYSRGGDCRSPMCNYEFFQL